MLQEPLHKGDVIAVVLVNLSSIPLAETVSADALIAKVVADNSKLLLNGSLCDRENALVTLYPIPKIES